MKGLLCLIGFVLCWCGAVAQVWNKEGAGSGAADLRGIQEFLEKVVEEGSEADYQELEGIFRHRMLHPLDINSAGREELEGLHLLTDFQIESLLEYRNRSGYILSRTELQMINGFDAHSVALIAPLVRFSHGLEGKDDTYFAGIRGKDTLIWYKKITSELLAKWWWKESSDEWLGPDFYSQLRFKGDYDNKLRFGFTTEKDAGELVWPAADFLSGYLMASNIAVGRKISISNFVVGDYSVRLGQGLVMWGGAGFSSAANVQGMYRKGAQLHPYSSADENGFLRGVAATARRSFSVGKGVGVTAFFSLKDVDARIEDGKYTSLKTDGLHNTESTLQTRKTLGELIYGASIQYWNHRIRVGLNWAGYGYNAYNGRKVQEYNKYQMYDGQWGNLSADINAIWGGKRIFAEVACDYSGAPAVLAGVSLRKNGWDCGLTIRSYSKRYIAPYAGAYSTISSVSNQNGVQLIAQKNIGRGRMISFGADVAHYPWKRYGVPEESGAVKLWGRLEQEKGRFKWNAKLYGSADTYGTDFKCGIKGFVSYNASGWLQLKLRSEAVTLEGIHWGAAVGTDMIATALKGRLRGVLHGAYYNCREWDCRLYMYEYDLPLSYSSRLQYGEGVAAYALVSYKFGRKGVLYIKGDSSGKAKVGLKMRFF